ncbi:MAG: phosphohydrolase [Chitinophagales bacterium]|nr:MAG: phosphohydrolase [Chitinophagales bacterium]
MKDSFLPVVNKRKIFNDPVYGFISIPFELIFDLIEHPYFQRLRRITQLGLSYYVYPGAYHTRFHHALGALHLMTLALDVLQYKGHKVTRKEAEAACAAILLHDIGHGPFSHTLENCLIPGVSHEFLSSRFMEALNADFRGRLSLAIDIFRDNYKKRFLHQLISSQLDVDRLDYLKRDSFFTGVQEGVIGHDRIIKMLEVKDDRLVVEEKGIYSIEKFLVARRLMYWQVYLHKTVLAAESLLVKIMQRAKELALNNVSLDASPPLKYFLYNNVSRKSFMDAEEPLEQFARLDDVDVLAAVKLWTRHPDTVLSLLCKALIERKLPKIELRNEPFPPARIERIKKAVKLHYELSQREEDYFVYTSSTSNFAYDPEKGNINILYKDGRLMDITRASDQLNISVLSRPVVKYYLCYPKFIALK